MRFELKTVILEDLSYNERESSTNKFLNTAQKIKFSIMNFFSKCDQILSFLRIWSHLVEKSLMENFIFCAMRTSHLRGIVADNKNKVEFNSTDHTLST